MPLGATQGNGKATGGACAACAAGMTLYARKRRSDREEPVGKERRTRNPGKDEAVGQKGSVSAAVTLTACHSGNAKRRPGRPAGRGRQGRKRTSGQKRSSTRRIPRVAASSQSQKGEKQSSKSETASSCGEGSSSDSQSCRVLRRVGKGSTCGRTKSRSSESTHRRCDLSSASKGQQTSGLASGRWAQPRPARARACTCSQGIKDRKQRRVPALN